MPLAGTLTKKAQFKRSTAGSLHFTGASSKLKGIIKAVAGNMGRFAGTLTRKVYFKRTIEGAMHMAGTVSKFARFSRTVAGAIHFSGIATRRAVFKAAAGAIHFAGVLTRKVMFKRSVAGTMAMIGEGSKTQAYRVRLVSGAMHFKGLARGAAMYVLKGLSRFGFSLKNQ